MNRCLSIKGAEDTINKPYAFEISTIDDSMFFIADSEKVQSCSHPTFRFDQDAMTQIVDACPMVKGLKKPFGHHGSPFQPKHVICSGHPLARCSLGAGRTSCWLFHMTEYAMFQVVQDPSTWLLNRFWSVVLFVHVVCAFMASLSLHQDGFLVLSFQDLASDQPHTSTCSFCWARHAQAPEPVLGCCIIRWASTCTFIHVVRGPT